MRKYGDSVIFTPSVGLTGQIEEEKSITQLNSLSGFDESSNSQPKVQHKIDALNAVTDERRRFAAVESNNRMGPGVRAVETRE